jgi:hypothetical protein
MFEQSRASARIRLASATANTVYSGLASGHVTGNLGRAKTAEICLLWTDNDTYARNSYQKLKNLQRKFPRSAETLGFYPPTFRGIPRPQPEKTTIEFILAR